MTTYEESKVQLVVNRMDNNCYNALSSKSNEEIYIVSSNPSGVVKIDLDAVEMVRASVSTMASSIAGLASSVSAMTSTMTGLESSISAVAGSLNVSGIGCSTIVLSGTYSDSTSFAYNFVIQPSA